MNMLEDSFFISEGNINNILTRMMVATESFGADCGDSVILTETAISILIERS